MSDVKIMLTWWSVALLWQPEAVIWEKKEDRGLVRTPYILKFREDAGRPRVLTDGMDEW